MKEVIAGLEIGVLGVVISAFFMLARAVINVFGKKNKKALEIVAKAEAVAKEAFVDIKQELDIQCSFSDLVISDIPKAIVDAEEMGMVGKAKLSYVLSQIMMKCSDKKIPFDSAETTKIIEGIIDVTKKVNVAKKKEGYDPYAKI